MSLHLTCRKAKTGSPAWLGPWDWSSCSLLSPPDSQASPHLPPRPCTGGGKRGPRDSGMVPSCFPASPRVLPPSPLSSELGRFLLSSVQRPPSLILPCPLSGGLEDPGTPPAPSHPIPVLRGHSQFTIILSPPVGFSPPARTGKGPWCSWLCLYFSPSWLLQP